MYKTKIWSFIFFMLVAGNVFGQKEWNEYKTRHFIIYYKESPLDFVKTVGEQAELSYDEINRDLGFSREKSWSFDDRAKIFIYNDQEDYISSAEQASWSHGAASAKDKTIRTFPTAHGFFDSTLLHELGHIIFREFVGYRSFIPLWFDEGVAMYQEKARRFGSHKRVQEAMEQGVFIPLSELSTIHLTQGTGHEVIQLFYAEAASIVYYMINELGQFRFLNFCRNLKKGESFNEALRSTYIRFKDVDDLNQAWLNYLK